MLLQVLILVTYATLAAQLLKEGVKIPKSDGSSTSSRALKSRAETEHSVFLEPAEISYLAGKEAPSTHCH